MLDMKFYSLLYYIHFFVIPIIHWKFTYPIVLFDLLRIFFRTRTGR